MLKLARARAPKGTHDSYLGTCLDQEELLGQLMYFKQRCNEQNETKLQDKTSVLRELKLAQHYSCKTFLSQRFLLVL